MFPETGSKEGFQLSKGPRHWYQPARKIMSACEVSKFEVQHSIRRQLSDDSAFIDRPAATLGHDGFEHTVHLDVIAHANGRKERILCTCSMVVRNNQWVVLRLTVPVTAIERRQRAAEERRMQLVSRNPRPSARVLAFSH